MQQVKNKRTNGGKTVRFEQEAPNASASSDPYVVLWSILRVVRHIVGRGPYLCRSQVIWMTTYTNSALDAFFEMDGRNSRYIRVVLERY